MSNAYATPLHLEIRVPFWWPLSLAVLHGFVLVVILLLPISVAVQAALLSFFLALAVWQLAPWVWPRHPRRIRSAVWGEGDLWRLQCGDGRRLEAQMASQFYQLGPVTQLHLVAADGRRYQLTLLASMLEAQTLRRLRVRLRLFALQDHSAQHAAPHL